MGSGTDTVSWYALGTSLTVVGLLVALLVWRRRGVGSGLKAAAWALLPLAAALTGLLRLLADLADALVRWATRLVFSPVVWLGVVLAGVAVLLWLTGTAISARTSRKAVGPGPAGTARRAPTPRARSGSGGSGGSGGLGGSGGSVVEDQDDIEAILRKHGIQ